MSRVIITSCAFIEARERSINRYGKIPIVFAPFFAAEIVTASINPTFAPPLIKVCPCSPINCPAFQLLQNIAD